jgi:hypothetical protein
VRSSSKTIASFTESASTAALRKTKSARRFPAGRA